MHHRISLFVEGNPQLCQQPMVFRILLSLLFEQFAGFLPLTSPKRSLIASLNFAISVNLSLPADHFAFDAVSYGDGLPFPYQRLSASVACPLRVSRDSMGGHS